MAIIGGGFLGGGETDASVDAGILIKEAAEGAITIELPEQKSFNHPSNKKIMTFPQKGFSPESPGAIANSCLYVDGMAAFELGTGTSYNYVVNGWMGAQTNTGANGYLPNWDTKSFQPSNINDPAPGSSYKDDFRHAIGKDWLTWGQNLFIPAKFTQFWNDLDFPIHPLPLVGFDTSPPDYPGYPGGVGSTDLLITKYRGYDTPIDNWYAFFSESPQNINLNPYIGLGYDVAKENYQQTMAGESPKLVPGTLGTMAKRQLFIHAYYPQGQHHGTDAEVYLFGTTEFMEKNPVFNSWLQFNTWSNNKFNQTPFNWTEENLANTPGVTIGDPNTYPYYYDHHFVMQKPFNYKNIENSFMKGAMYVKIKPHYNFTEPKYEGVIANPSVPEAILPNMYVFLSETELNNLDPSEGGFKSGADSASEGVKAKSKPSAPSEYLEIMTLGGNLPNVFVDILNKQGKKIGEKQDKPYFSMWTNSYNDIAENSPLAIEAYSAKLSNVAFSKSGLKLLSESSRGYGSDRKEQMFPMAMEIEFSTDQNTEFSDIMDKSGLSKKIMLEIMNRTISELQYGIPAFHSGPFVHASQKQPTMIGEDGNLNTNTDPTISLNATYNETMDFDSWVTNLPEATAMNSGDVPSEAIFMGVEQEDKDVAPMQKLIDYSSFLSKYKHFIAKHFRENIDLTFGGTRPAYNETLLYRIEKRVGQKIVQNFYLPNSSNIDILRFFDTQVKYGVDYTYRIYAYQLVVSTRYAYSQLYHPTPDQFQPWYQSFTDVATPWDPWFAFGFVDYEPSAKIIEVPWYEFTQTMIDHPPSPPEVDFVPYRGIKDEILINMTENNGEYLMHPVSIEDSDEQQHDLMRKALQIPKGEPILYKGDDPVIAYQIYRTTSKPKKYEDFSQKLIKTVDTIKEGTSFRDTPQPNTKYYYIIRAIDRHFHFSNPSAIYEVELIADSTQNIGALSEISGLTAVKPVVKIVELKTEIAKSLFKPMRKYLRILPVMEQAMISETEMPFSAYEDKKIKLGLTDNPLFGAHGAEGRKFKIRLTSKKSGKKIDVNVDFKAKYEKFDISDLEDHLPSLYDAAYSDIEFILDELKGDVAKSIIEQSAGFFTTEYEQKSKSASSISVIDKYSAPGQSGIEVTAANLKKVAEMGMVQPPVVTKTTFGY